MKELWNWIQVGLAAVGGFLGWFLGGMDGFMYALIAFVVVDYLTGVMRAIIEKELSSRVGARGIIKKILIFLLVGVAHLTDMYLLGDGNALRTAVVFFYISNEGISLLENATAIGLPVPEKLKETLSQLHKKPPQDTGKGKEE
jgi:toxin secretion/phage lysis holin